MVNEPRLRRADVYRECAAVDGTGSGEGLPAKVESSEHRKKHCEQSADSGPGNRREISDRAPYLQPSRLYQQNRRRAGRLVSDRAGHCNHSNDCVGKEHPPPPREHAVFGLCFFGEGSKSFSTSQLFAVPPESPRKTARSESRRRTL